MTIANPPLPETLLVLPHLLVQNANAMPSPLSWGFPPPSAFAGFAHVLHRALSAELNLHIAGVGIICHAFSAQASLPAGRHAMQFHLSRHPVTHEGKAASMVEEGRCHLDISLVLGLSGDGLWQHTEDVLLKRLQAQVAIMRLAGGSLLPNPHARQPWLLSLEAPDAAQRKALHRLMPGFALVCDDWALERHWRKLCQHHADATLLDALHDAVGLHHQPGDKPDKNGYVDWQWAPKSGWRTPLALGYAALSPLYAAGAVRNARDVDTPIRFAEPLLGLGQWLSPHRLGRLHESLWFHHADPDAGLYRLHTPFYQPAVGAADTSI